jgi:hypothetical protein
MNSDTAPATNAVTEKRPTAPETDAVRAALIARLARIRPVPIHVRPAQSLQPTPEAAKTRAARLRRKRHIILQKSKLAGGSRLDALPAAPDPLAP